MNFRYVFLLLLFSAFSSSAVAQVSCWADIKGLALNGNRLVAKATLYSKKNDILLPGKEYEEYGKVKVKICNFQSTEGKISPNACPSIFSLLKDQTRENSKIKLVFTKGKDCSEINGKWVSAVKTELVDD